MEIRQKAIKNIFLWTYRNVVQAIRSQENVSILPSRLLGMPSMLQGGR